MKYLKFIVLAAVMLAAGRASAVEEKCVRFVESTNYTLPGSDPALAMGMVCLRSDGHLWILSKFTGGTKNGKTEWQDLTATGGVVPFSSVGSCAALSSYTLLSIMPWVDGNARHFQAADPPNANWSGTYGPLGDGNRTLTEGGDVRAGVAVRVDHGGGVVKTHVFVMKIASDHGGGGYCGSPNLNGPGFVGQWMLIPISPAIQ